MSKVSPAPRAALPMGASVLTFRRPVDGLEVDKHQGMWAQDWQEPQRAGHEEEDGTRNKTAFARTAAQLCMACLEQKQSPETERRWS